ncbi:MAG TPA: thioesterase family protein [Terriglobales bacterium]|nr:thioesterase family protein [Terriglobales bacterium]
MISENQKPFSESRLRVRYAETDQMGVVYHANYFVWFEVGRVDLLRQLGFNYKDMESQDGCRIAVADARCRYKSPALYDDQILVRTHIRRVRSSMVQFGYKVLRETDSQLLAEGETTHIVTDADLKVTNMPEKYVQAFRAAVERSRVLQGKE